jgi:hypothetical protein
MITTDHTPLLASTETQSPNSRNFGSTVLKIIPIAMQVIKNITAFIGRAATFCKQQLEKLSTRIPSIFQQTQAVTTPRRPRQAVLAEEVVPFENLFPPQENQAPVILPRSVTNAETGENGAVISAQIPSDESQPPEMAYTPLLPNAGQIVPYTPSLYTQMAKIADERLDTLFKRSFEVHKELSLPGQTTQLTSGSHELPFQIPLNFCEDSIVLKRNYNSPSYPKNRVNNFFKGSFYSKYLIFQRVAPSLPILSPDFSNLLCLKARFLNVAPDNIVQNCPKG